MNETYKFKTTELEESLSGFAKQGITEFTLQDQTVLGHKGKLLSFLKTFEKKCPQVLLTLPVSADVLDMDVCKACSRLFCTLEIALTGSSKGNAYLFDKKFYSKRAQMLNTLGLIFGFDIDFAAAAGDGIKAFLDRLDFAVSLYPNHIDFLLEGIKPSATYSTQDIKRSEKIAAAAECFYTYGRAVTWFLSVLSPLKMSASRFFEDFAEWCSHNNYKLEGDWEKLKADHKEIEKMQLAFLKFKYEEKHKADLFEVVSNVVRLNGALSRCFGENEECEVEMSYNPEEILSGGAMNIQKFFENAFMEYSTVKVFMGPDGPDFKYC